MGDIVAGLHDLALAPTSQPLRPSNSTPKINLPLPRELRDQIWGYLLIHKHVHEPVYVSKVDSATDKPGIQSVNHAGTYSFQTSILATNKTIKSEADEVLDANRFIVISYDWVLMSRWLHTFDCPVITESKAQIARFQRHVLRIHLAGSKLDVAGKISSCLIVAADLPKMLEGFRLCLHHSEYAGQLFVQTSLESNPVVTFTVHERKDSKLVLKIMVQFNRAVTENLETSALEKVLAPLGGVSHVGLNVKFMNVPTLLEPTTSHLLRCMALKSGYALAMIWQVIDTAVEIKTKADRLMSDDQTLRASEEYQKIWRLLRTCKLLHIDSSPKAPLLGAGQTFLCCLAVTSLLTDGFRCLGHAPFDESLARDIHGCALEFLRYREDMPSLTADFLDYVKGTRDDELVWLASMLNLLMKPLAWGNAGDALRALEHMAPTLSHSVRYERDVMLLREIIYDEMVSRIVVCVHIESIAG